MSGSDEVRLKKRTIRNSKHCCNIFRPKPLLTKPALLPVFLTVNHDVYEKPKLRNGQSGRSFLNFTV